jgi:hypothetical protein
MRVGIFASDGSQIDSFGGGTQFLTGADIGTGTGTIALGSTTTGNPSFTTAKVNPLSLSTIGGLRTEGVGAAGTAAGGVFSVQGIASMTPVLVTGTGTAGTAATGVVTVQGIASGTTLPVSLITGFATATLQGAGLPPALAADGGLKVTAATLDAAVDSAVTTAPVQTGGIFETTPTVIETGDAAVFHFDANQNLRITGSETDGTADAGNPLKIGGKAVATAPAVVDAGDRVNATFTLTGGQLVNVGSVPQDRWQANSGTGNIADQTAISVITHTDNLYTVVTNLIVTNSDATVGTLVRIISGTGTVCATNTVTLWAGYAAAVGGGFAMANPEGIFSATIAADDVCIIAATTSAEIMWSASGFKSALKRVP